MAGEMWWVDEEERHPDVDPINPAKRPAAQAQRPKVVQMADGEAPAASQNELQRLTQDVQAARATLIALNERMELVDRKIDALYKWLKRVVVVEGQ